MAKSNSTVGDLEKHIATKHEIQCHFCGFIGVCDFSQEMTSILGACAWFYGKGWRQVSSRKFQAIAAACPDCAPKKDKDR